MLNPTLYKSHYGFLTCLFFILPSISMAIEIMAFNLRGFTIIFFPPLMYSLIRYFLLAVAYSPPHLSTSLWLDS